MPSLTTEQLGTLPKNWLRQATNLPEFPDFIKKTAFGEQMFDRDFSFQFKIPKVESKRCKFVERMKILLRSINGSAVGAGLKTANKSHSVTALRVERLSTMCRVKDRRFG